MSEQSGGNPRGHRRRRIGIAVLGLGWMGQAHSRSALRIPSLFPDRAYHPALVVCADPVPAQRERAVDDFGFERAVSDWHEAVSAPDVDAVWVTAPNMLHVEMIEAACELALRLIELGFTIVIYRW